MCLNNNVLCRSAILFIIEDTTFNIADQCLMEFYIRKRCPEIKVIRRTLTEIFDRGSLNDEKKLFIDDIEVRMA